jgi:protein involved in polysaccharide export with SLBB domain
LVNDITWDYAQVIRRIPSTLGSEAITFNLGRAVLLGSAADNIALEPGDQITLFTTSQLAQPTERRSMLVTVSGEVAVPGVYQVKPGETLPQLLKRVGGLTPQAYLFGAHFSRASVRARQQENLDNVLRKLEAQMQAQHSSVNGLSISDKSTGAAIAQAQQAQFQAQIGRLRSFRSNGRLSLELDTRANSLAALPALPLEDGDSINIPVVPGFVSAVGSVNNENAVIYKPGKTVGDVIKTAGLTEDAEADQSFVLRADGTVVAKRDTGGFFGGGFEGLEVMPGDTLVVPTQVVTETRYNFLTRALRDWTQIFFNFGLGVAALKSL